MTDGDRWTRARDLFERALDEQPANMDAWLDAEAAGDRELHAEVRSLLDHHTRAGAFLSDPAGDRLTDLLAEDRALQPGQAIGPYTVVREAGRGGMGRVYLATDSRLGRDVALKALSPELTADPRQRERLRREARAAAALKHPGICTIYALEEFEDDLFIATEFVDGHTLRDEIQRGSRPHANDVERTAVDLAAALAHAHAHGITHRDLKPDNVMRTKDGQLKILDFGLAQFETPSAVGAPGERHITEPGTIVGTLAYMAPEQLNGQPVDARADVFALGVLLYEYACGEHPFRAQTPLAMMARILEGDARSLDERRADLPSHVVAVIEGCLQKHREDRFESAVDVDRVLHDAAPVTRPGRMIWWWRIHQLAAVAMYFVACLLTWQIKEAAPGVPTAIFVLVGIASMVAGVFRGHLLFTERMNAAGLVAERRRAGPVTLAADGLIAVAVGADGVMLAAFQPLLGLLTIALGLGIALARLIVEPATTSASFEHSRHP